CAIAAYGRSLYW
nr:immunoglobulin heavy chain junction region [Macaca mulatta]MOY28297.1 immunoglobulin heavy chain junction region [Macaca mulatta]MOY29814.1 immunoglobulin heavy chain junction region [Macaca mulatta]MOY30643.1 immunoglobulin heavy chain junction region [Macaca mulatta]